MFDIPCIIFAGGKSSRMGEDKSLLPFDASPTLTQYQLQKLQKIFKKVFISCKDKNKFSFKANFIEDIKENNTFAPTNGFISIFENIPDDKFFVLSVDSPFLSSLEIKKIIKYDTDNVDATIARTSSGIQPMCGVYHRTLEHKFKDMLQQNNHKLGYLLKNSNTQYLDFDDETPFFNINHPHEYQKALTLI
jgi:molybdenum cofactor guanylyltransferase